ncbi:hypothetical protein H2200_008013 [Cladophialophora chaetospira]|uniref:Uncharacterized protein n=1 Tax=Cladophialophora chaetospira TaxID=386627 RepID=A0AA39CGZ1_9EURO|nr:hypothetical protein H2200_008013 [Cladophialophora chaetospira]
MDSSPLKRKRSIFGSGVQDDIEDHKRIRELSPADSAISNEALTHLTPWLPSEIIPMIWKSCDADTLKTMRLTCMLWADEIGKILFRHVTMIPHIYFMERFVDTFKPSKVCGYIRRLVVRVSWVDQLSLLHEKYIESQKYDAGHRAHTSSFWTLEDFYKIYPPESRDHHMIALEIAVFAKVIALLPHVRVLQTDFRYQPSSDEPGSFQPPAWKTLLRRFDLEDTEHGVIGESNHNPGYAFAFCTSLMYALAVNDFRLQALYLHDLDPTALSLPEFDEEEGNEKVHPATLFLGFCKRLVWLEVTIADHRDWRGAQAEIAESSAALLQKNFTCKQNELAIFLNAHCPRLRNLVLMDIVLLGQSDEKKACWVALLDSLRRVFNRRGPWRRRIDFQGFFTNLGRQHWHVENNDGRPAEGVKSKMVEWFRDKDASLDTCPLRVFRIGQDENDVTVPDDILIQATDLSWSMSCPAEDMPIVNSDSSSSSGNSDAGMQDAN